MSADVCGYCKRDLVEVGPPGKRHYVCPSIAVIGQLCDKWDQVIPLQEPSKTEKPVWDPPV